MIDHAAYAPLDISAASRSRRVESLAETALQLAETYEREGRWDRALALIDAVLRDPDLPGGRTPLAARLWACRGRLLLAEALHDTGDFDPAIAALHEAAELAEAAGDQPTAALVQESLRQAYTAPAAGGTAAFVQSSVGADSRATQPLDGA